MQAVRVRSARLIGALLLLALVLAMGLPRASAAADGVPAEDVRFLFHDFRPGSNQIVPWTARWDGTDRQMLGQPGSWRAYDWSPDGTRIVGVRYGSNGGEIVVVTSDGEFIAQLTSNEYAEYGASWSPDGTKIFFFRGEDFRYPWVMAADGSHQHRLADERGWGGGVWSPDSKRFAYATSNDPSSVVIVHVDGRDPVTIENGSPMAWSPDGTKLLFHRRLDDRVWVTDVQGTATPLFSSDHGEQYVSWSHDGEHLVYLRDRDIWVADGDGGSAVRRVTAAGAEGILGQLPGTGLIAFTTRAPDDGDDTTEPRRDLAVVPITGNAPPTVIGPWRRWIGTQWSRMPTCTVTGSQGDDVLKGTTERDVICGFGGHDRIIGSAGADVILGGPGMDKLDLREAPRGVTVDLADGTAGKDTVWGVSSVLGTQFDDVFFGDDGRNVFASYGGDDALIGRGGDDTLLGGPGDDLLRPGLGGDDVDGAEGRDTVSFADATARVRVNLTDGFAIGQGDEDVLVALEKVIGSSFDDFVVGAVGRNVIKGGDGDDTLDGQSGPDDIFGGTGRDVLFGRSGDDALEGGTGSDYLNGGDGRDSCSSGTATLQC